jgi:hypothetical protein
MRPRASARLRLSASEDCSPETSVSFAEDTWEEEVCDVDEDEDGDGDDDDDEPSLSGSSDEEDIEIRSRSLERSKVWSVPLAVLVGKSLRV